MGRNSSGLYTGSMEGGVYTGHIAQGGMVGGIPGWGIPPPLFTISDSLTLFSPFRFPERSLEQQRLEGPSRARPTGDLSGDPSQGSSPPFNSPERLGRLSGAFKPGRNRGEREALGPPYYPTHPVYMPPYYPFVGAPMPPYRVCTVVYMPPYRGVYLGVHSLGETSAQSGPFSPVLRETSAQSGPCFPC